MKLIKLFIVRILATWALLVFATTMLLFFPFYMICFLLKDPVQITYHRFLSRMWIYQFATVIVDRKDNASRRKSYDNMKRVLNDGVDMLIYPEGTRNRTSAPLKSFYDGAFTLAIETQKPIVPVVILNTKKILPAKPSMCLRPGKIILNILPPIFPEGHTALTLKKEVFQIMSDYYLKNQK